MPKVEIIEYVYGKNGKIEGVIIPIDAWEKIKMKFFDPSKYRGIYRNRKNKFYLDEALEELRTEWERDI